MPTHEIICPIHDVSGVYTQPYLGRFPIWVGEEVFFGDIHGRMPAITELGRLWIKDSHESKGCIMSSGTALWDACVNTSKRLLGLSPTFPTRLTLSSLFPHSFHLLCSVECVDRWFLWTKSRYSVARPIGSQYRMSLCRMIVSEHTSKNRREGCSFRGCAHRS